jgi:nicotinate-nucleotide--dimethylbenzimidazole phosphoribosyltransferase
VEAGISLAEEASKRFDVVAISQIGFGAATGASALLSTLLHRSAAEATFCDDLDSMEAATARRKTVQLALLRNQTEALSAPRMLSFYCGADIAAMTGFLLASALFRLPVFVDGFCASAAALVARAIAPDSLDAMLFPGCSNDPAWILALQALEVTPLLRIDATESAGLHAVLAMRMVGDALKVARTLAVSVLSRRGEQ